ncbi:hypothetical protein V5739_06980 [Salinimicrobium sp. TIG7-5_MAKvit]|uniref:hypothetical protein n=1 Tax=Salinimicrobium sp. TIG7-5_MAKvit TaxID=3121289 RepID=UPI003C6E3155
MKNGWLNKLGLSLLLALFGSFGAKAQIQEVDILNAPVDVSKDFVDYNNTFYFADELVDFDPKTGKGTVKYLRHDYQTRQAFNNMLMRPVPVEANEFPTTEYEISPELPFEVQFVSDRTVRIKMASGPQFHKQKESLMLIDGVAPNHPELWKYSKIEGGHSYSNQNGRVEILTKPWHVKLYDETGKLLTSTLHLTDVENTYKVLRLKIAKGTFLTKMLFSISQILKQLIGTRVN